MSYEEMKERGRRTRLMTREHRCIAFLRVRESWVWETVVRRLPSPIAGASPG